MAASAGKVLCRYYMNGACSKGALCPFSHSFQDNPDMTCRYYLKGSCVYGSGCRYSHVRPKTQEDKKEGRSSVKVSGPVSLPSIASEQRESTSTATPAFVTLTKDPSRTPKRWVNAPEFVPGKKFHTGHNQEPQKEIADEEDPLSAPWFSYSDVASSGVDFLDIITPEEAASLLCPFAEKGCCPFGDVCEYLHGDVCDMCNRHCLNPFDPEQQKEHRRECLLMHEVEMERAFLEQGSEGKTCGICMEVVKNKPTLSERRFGILSNCDHCFCLNCIRKWRSSTHTTKKTIRACPLCRQVSYVVVPSEVWVDDPVLKVKLFDEYKSNLSKRHCKYFDQGKGTCPFGNSCFYKHEFPDGTKAVITERVGTNAEGESKVIRGSLLWDFLAEREEGTRTEQAEDWAVEMQDGANQPAPRHQSLHDSEDSDFSD